MKDRLLMIAREIYRLLSFFWLLSLSGLIAAATIIGFPYVCSISAKVLDNTSHGAGFWSMDWAFLWICRISPIWYLITLLILAFVIAEKALRQLYKAKLK